jgi:DNA-binding NarL/FixJ family response regulator
MIRTMHGGCTVRDKREVGLGPRERMVLEAYVRGKADRETARDLGRSVHTIRATARTLRRKFGIARMEDLVAAVKRGDFRIRRSEERYNLASALKVLDEGLRAMHARQERAPIGNPRASVRLHELEAEALLRIGRAVLGEGAE